jgi:hypothetical protein
MCVGFSKGKLNRFKKEITLLPLCIVQQGLEV